jgi:hypothetical protein
VTFFLGYNVATQRLTGKSLEVNFPHFWHKVPERPTPLRPKGKP